MKKALTHSNSTMSHNNNILYSNIDIKIRQLWSLTALGSRNCDIVFNHSARGRELARQEFINCFNKGRFSGGNKREAIKTPNSVVTQTNKREIS